MKLTDKIIPYKGTESIALYTTLKDVRDMLKKDSYTFRQEVWRATSDDPNPFTVIIIDNVMSLFFAQNMKLFKIVLWENYKGCLPNGIHPRMPLAEAQTIDPELTFDEWNEVYLSPAGYWLEDNLNTKEALSISVFIKEIEDDDLFDSCAW
ncbi:MAG: hypothetical protein IJ229_05120 [Clostridia bacterium]|nr:hypothetical protein [Clostridia bacterium]MBR1686408.1 hypothetical protein [Clostridia bacterium]MBR2288248.1 hypothetical protein [Clostridia bacterium]